MKYQAIYDMTSKNEDYRIQNKEEINDTNSLI